MSEQTFEEAFADSVEEGLFNVLGESATRATMKHLDLGPRIKDSEQLDMRLVALFSKPGALVIERQIIKALLEKINEKMFEVGRLNFKQRIDDVRRRFTGWDGERP